MSPIARQLLWALLLAALSLPVFYIATLLIWSLLRRGYVSVDPVILRRISVACAVCVFVASVIVQRLR
jgi:hypothetical protein